MNHIDENFALTIEPRLNAQGLPSISFHVIVAFEGGQKAVITEFDPLFELFDMTYLTS